MPEAIGARPVSRSQGPKRHTGVGIPFAERDQAIRCAPGGRALRPAQRRSTTRRCACPRFQPSLRLDRIRRRLKKTSRPEIPRKAIYRLSVYLPCLHRLKANSIRTVSSDALAAAAGVKPTQLRKDLTYFGQFGTRGLGYDVEQLAKMITDLLGTNSLQPVILVGVGNLGLALLSYRGFEQEGFEIVAAFDVDPDRKREKPLTQPIHGMEKLPGFIREHSVRMAILTVPAVVAQEVANQLVEAGITGILNFAPLVLQVPEEVVVNNVNLAIELENLSYFIQD